MGLYQKYRPKNFTEVLGQDESVKILSSLLKKNQLPRAILFTGESGCGKTTLARILKSELKCGDLDFVELNSADFRGIDTVRDLRGQINLSPINGKCRIFLIDECHQMTKDAQNAILKMLEDTPKHVYFMLATTEPTKLIAAIKTRCTEIKVRPVSDALLSRLVNDVYARESKEKGNAVPLDEEVVDRIVSLSEGSARKAVVLLESVFSIPSPEEQVLSLEKNNYKHEAIEIARALFNPKSKWIDVAKLLNIEEEPEKIRHLILGYATKILLSGGRACERAHLIISVFRDNWYDCGKAGLVSCCYEVVTAK